MAHQEEGWPLGLQLLNVRVGLGGRRARDYFGSISFNNAIASSSTSYTDSSSDLDTQSTGSFFHDRTMTLGSLMRASSNLELSRRRPAEESLKPKNKSRTWFFSLCSKDSTNVRNPENAPSLRQFLAVERRSSPTTTTNGGNLYGRTRNPDSYLVPEEMSLAQHLSSVSSSLFVNGQIAPPPPRLQVGLRSAGNVNVRSTIRGLDEGAPVVFSCVCCNVVE